MRHAGLSLLALLGACVLPAPPPSDDSPMTSAPSGALAPGQAPVDVRPAPRPERSPDARILQTHASLLARDARGFSRAFRDTSGALRGPRPTEHAVPVRAGWCYRVYVSADGAEGNEIVVRLFDAGVRPFVAGALLEEDGGYGPFVVLGRRRPLCASSDRPWLLEIGASGDAGAYVVSVLARSGADRDEPAAALRWSP